MKKLAVIGVALGLAFGLAGCSTTVSEEQSEEGVGVKGDSSRTKVYVVEVPTEGKTVTCAALVGTYRGALTCDWENAK